MGDAPPAPGSGDTGVSTGGEPATGTPRWVKVFGVLTLLVVVLVVVVLLAGGPGRHGPGRHGGGGDSPPSSVREHRPPAGARHGQQP